jgi:hypothetical protein
MMASIPNAQPSRRDVALLVLVEHRRDTPRIGVATKSLLKLAIQRLEAAAAPEIGIASGVPVFG